MKYLIGLLISVLFVGCGPKEQPKITEKFELRQLVQKTETTTSSSASFFVVIGSYSSKTESVTTVKVCAKVEGMYRFIDMPMESIRINIDSTITKPSIQIQYTNYNELTGNTLLETSYLYNKCFIINCPEKYLPENLLPIGI